MLIFDQTCYDAIVAFTRWDPLHDLLTLHGQIGQLAGIDAHGWSPLVDLYETSSTFVLSAELPGLARDQIEVQAEEDRIVIRGERHAYQMPCEQYHRMERGHGSFSRAFVLPEPIEVDGITADLQDGILTVTIPKTRGRGTRRVSVT